MGGALAESLGLAFDRIDDFVAVQSPLSTHDLGPVMCLWEAAGVGDRERALLVDRIRRLARTEHSGDVALGVLIGLLAGQPH
jgi:hypothetical protein